MQTTVKSIIKFITISLAIACALLPDSALAAGNIHTSEKYIWSENAGWLDFRPTHGGVTFHDNGTNSYLSGYAWAGNIGWVLLGNPNGGPYTNTTATDWGVNADAAGNLSGYAWNEVAGWVNFNPTHGQVVFDVNTGSFSGQAWSGNIGWINFKNISPSYNVLSPRLRAG